MELPEWKLYSLEMDDAGREIGEHFQTRGYDIARINPFGNEPLKSIHKRWVAYKIAKAISADKRILAVYGDGCFHHATYGLARLADRLSDNYCYMHIDQHDDFCGYGQQIGCGSFTGQISTDSNAKGNVNNIIYIGANSKDVVSVTAQMITRKNTALLDEMLQSSAKDAYISIDLDVLHPSEIKTGWPRDFGTLMKNEMFGILDKILSCKRIISADIVGYNGEKNVTGTMQASKETSLRLYEDLAKMIMRA